MNKIKEYVISDVSKYLTEYNFEWQKSNQQFIQKNKEYDCIFYVVITFWNDYVSIEPFAYINWKKVENSYSKIIKVEGRAKYTIGGNSGIIKHGLENNFIDNKKAISFTVSSVDEANTTIDHLKEIIDFLLESFYKKYNSLIEIDNLFNSPKNAALQGLIFGSYQDHCIKGLILAKLVKRDDYISLVIEYDKLIKKMESPAADMNYSQAKNYLQENKL